MIKFPRKNWFALASLASAVLLAVMLVPAAAQREGPPPPQRDGPGPQRDGGNPGIQQIEMMSKMMGLVGEMSKVAESASATGVFTVMRLDDTLKDPAEQIKFLERVLPEVKDPAVQRAIRQKLADNYKKAGQNEKALAEIERLITGKVGG